MLRTQIYLTEDERSSLKALGQATGKSQSELIRDAIDQLLLQENNLQRETAIDRAAGMWKDREDLPDFQKLRAEWDRS